MMASSHETFFSASECTYDVFLSFRGTDTCKSFTDHVYIALSDDGIHTFRDNDEIERGENINLELEKAIKMSRISIIVFSKDYVSSKQCRYEVETILEHSKKSKHVILPVFYDVDPSEVKKQAEGLLSNEGQDEQMNNVKRSSAALKEVVNLAGMVLKNQADGHESKSFIQEVVQWVKDKKAWHTISVATHPRNISTVTSLQEVDISDCSNLILSAEEFKKMESMKVLRADKIDISKALGVTNDVVPVGNGFVWPWVQKPMKNPNTLWTSFPSFLVSLSLANCNLTDDAFSMDFGRLNMLKSLSLGGNQIRRLPDCVGNLSRLQMLDLSWCPKLEKIQWPAIVVAELNVTQCRSLQQITYDTEARPLTIQHGACMRLCYVQNGFKTKPVREVDVRLINNVGFFSLDSMADVEVMITNCIVWSRVKRPVEILWECGLFSTYFPGREVPCWFMYKTNGPTITLNVPSSNHQTRGLNVCVVYTLSDIVNWLQDPIEVKVHNKTKHFVWPYRPRCYGVPEADGYIVWLCHLGFRVPIEEGDEVEVSFDMKVEGQIKECGAHLLYYEEVEEIKQYYNTMLRCWDSNYPLLLGAYLLSNHALQQL